ncbi:MAG: hypothetical protein ACXAC5_04395 [Promethearchaeota archaeon]
MVLEYVEQLKQDNKRLNKELDSKRRPLFDFSSPVQLLRDIADNGVAQTFFGIGIAILCILIIYGLFCIHGPSGKHYVIRAGSHTETIESECKCPEPERITKPCFKVMGEVTLGEDDYVEGCFFTKEDAYKAATEFTSEWERLNGRQEAE